MVNTAVICEYNLFHNGHKRQLEFIRSLYPDGNVIALMSGSFVQRGEAAVIPKYARAAAALECGADLVLELPCPYSCGSSEYFARGAVGIICKLGIVDCLCFGSESGCLDTLLTTSERLGSVEFLSRLRGESEIHRSDNMSFIKIKQRLYEDMYESQFPVSANDILGVEYLKALKLLSREGVSVKPLVIKRTGEESATLTRKYFNGRDFSALEAIVPKKAFTIYTEQNQAASYKQLERYILGFFRMREPASLRPYAEITGGIEYRICEAAREATDVESFFAMLSTKKYTDARLRRAVLNCLLGITEERLKAEPAFTCVLAANARGRELLRSLSKKADIAVITKPANYRKCSGSVAEQFEFAARADELYALATPEIMRSDFNLVKTPYLI